MWTARWRHTLPSTGRHHPDAGYSSHARQGTRGRGKPEAMEGEEGDPWKTTYIPKKGKNLLFVYHVGITHLHVIWVLV